MAAWHRKSDTQDPAKIYERKEAASCKGCIHRSTLWGAVICLKFDKLADRKCSRFQEKD